MLRHEPPGCRRAHAARGRHLPAAKRHRGGRGLCARAHQGAGRAVLRRMHRFLRQHLACLRHLQGQCQQASERAIEMRRSSCAAMFGAFLLPFVMHAASAQAVPAYDLRDITVGMPVSKLPDTGYVNLTCARDPDRKLTAWSAWRDCPADAQAMRAVRFDFDPATSQDGTKVAGHPVLLTALVDDKGTVSGLTIETDPKARLYIRKKAFLLGNQVKSRYGAEGWDCK